MKLTLPTDSNERKNVPMFRGLVLYFPAALAGVAMHSKAGNDKHNPGEPMHHARGKSSDHADCIARHLVDLGDLQAMMGRELARLGADQYDPEHPDVRAVLTEASALCWRALALSQELHERFGAPLAPAARLPTVAAPVIGLGCGAIDPSNGAICVRMADHEGEHMSGDQIERTAGTPGTQYIHAAECTSFDTGVCNCDASRPAPTAAPDRGEPEGMTRLRSGAGSMVVQPEDFDAAD